MQYPHLRRLPSLLLLIAVCGGCGTHKDLAVERAIQARYDQQDGAFSSGNVAGVAAICAPDYSETNRGGIAVRPKNWDTVAVSRRARRRANQQEIASLSEYREFLGEQFAGVQSLSVRSTILKASVNGKKDWAAVTVSRETQATLGGANGQSIPLSVQEQYDDTWIKLPGKPWLKQHSRVGMSNTRRDRMAESE